MQLSGTITVVAGGNTPIGSGIIKAFLLHNALVIAPLPDAQSVQALRKNMQSVTTGQLITVLADTMDYQRVNDIKNCIKDLYGYVNLVVSAFDNNWHGRSLLEIDLPEWQKAVDENITAHFITGRVALQLMKEQHGGMFVSICNADVLSDRPYASLTRLLTENQTELSVIFSEETRNYNIRYYHLFVKDVVTGQPVTEKAHPYLPTPQMTGEHIIKLYHKQMKNTHQLFQYFPEPIQEN